MKCFQCKEKVLEMVEINDYECVCPICNLKFDFDHANRTEEELRKNGYIRTSNEELADVWAQYFSTKYIELQIVKFGISEWIYINEMGRIAVESKFLELKNKIEKDLHELNEGLKLLR